MEPRRAAPPQRGAPPRARRRPSRRRARSVRGSGRLSARAPAVRARSRQRGQSHTQRSQRRPPRWPGPRPGGRAGRGKTSRANPLHPPLGGAHAGGARAGSARGARPPVLWCGSRATAVCGAAVARRASGCSGRPERWAGGLLGVASAAPSGTTARPRACAHARRSPAGGGAGCLVNMLLPSPPGRRRPVRQRVQCCTLPPRSAQRSATVLAQRHRHRAAAPCGAQAQPACNCS